MYCSFVDFALYAFRDIQFTCRVSQQVKEGQQLKGCKTCLYVQPVAFEMYEGIFHNYHGFYLSTCTNEPVGEDLCARCEAVVKKE